MRFTFYLTVLAALTRNGDAACANDCTGHGLCNKYSACECYRNWIGNDCSLRVCTFGRAFVDTPAGDLNMDGQITADTSVVNMITNTPRAELREDTYTAGNKLPGSFSEAHFYTECSGKGVCDRELGKCECFTGYEGEGCMRVGCPSMNPATCSGHGMCLGFSDEAEGEPWSYNSWDVHKTRKCKCDPGYEGVTCIKRHCPSGDDPVTKYEHVTTICGENWGLPPSIQHGRVVYLRDPSQRINDGFIGETTGGTQGTSKYEDVRIHGTVSGASALLSFFCGVKSTEVRPRELYNADDFAADVNCKAHKTVKTCTAHANCGWQAAITRASPSFGLERCLTVQGLDGLFTKSDMIVTASKEYLLNNTMRSQHDYREELIQMNEVQTVGVRGAACSKVRCSWDRATSKCSASTCTGCLYNSVTEAFDLPWDGLFRRDKHEWQAIANHICQSASAGSKAPQLGNGAVVAGAGTCASLQFDSGSMCTFRNPFALTFKGKHGAAFTTRSMECIDSTRIRDASTNGASDDTIGLVETIDTVSGFANAVQRSVSAEHCRSSIEFALESLPNSVVADVDVSDAHGGFFNDPLDDSSGENLITWIPGNIPISTQQDYSLNVNFISNTGDVAALTFIGRDNEEDAIEDDFMHHADSYSEPEITVTETRKGTTENAVCSNRGTCDFEYGLCKCFNGFTLAACSKQNVMAMY